jgi:diguanylate cyclase (GGDEF)-like protein
MIIDKTLLEQMSINDIEIFHRMALLDLTANDLDLIAAQKKIIEQSIEEIVEEFYRVQTSFEEVALVIGDSETMRRLRLAQRNYILELFSGYYDSEYVNSRLRIGLVHKRIGVEPKLFLSGVRTLKVLLSRTIERAITEPEKLRPTLEALDKLLQFDTTLVFDTYIDTMMSEAQSAKRRAESYASSMEEKAKLLSKHAERDSLTGLYNSRGMTKILSTELRMAQRRHALLSVIYLDVNDFKHINDTYGHAKGDEALRVLASCIGDNIRTADFPCRVGGDEFCVILPDCDRSGAVAIAARISSQFSLANPDYSISVGVAETGVQEYVTEEALLNIADEYMYAHKTGGRPKAAPKDVSEIKKRRPARKLKAS